MIDSLVHAALKAEFVSDFYLSENVLKTQQICERLRSILQNRLANSSDRAVEGFLALSIASHQLKHTLRACQLLVDCSRESEHSGKRVSINRLLNFLN